MPISAARIAIDGWRFALRAILAMPVLFGSALVLILFRDIFLYYVLPSSPPFAGAPSLFGSLIVAARDIPKTAIVASALIAVHRFVILGEVTDRQVWRLPANYTLFVGWLILLQVFSALPMDLARAISAARHPLLVL